MIYTVCLPVIFQEFLDWKSVFLKAPACHPVEKVDENLNMSHCWKCTLAAKANTTLSSIGRESSNRGREVIVPLYSPLLRPHPEYCSQVWGPQCRKNVELLERVQRRATKMIREGWSTSTTETGWVCLACSAQRRESFDRTRGDSFKLKEERFRLDIRGKFFTERAVVKCWNRLPREVVDAPSM